MVNCLVSLFGQWAGNGKSQSTDTLNYDYVLTYAGVVSYFLSGVLDTAGVKGMTILSRNCPGCFASSEQLIPNTTNTIP